MKYPMPQDRYDCSILCDNFREIDGRLIELEENGGGGSGSNITVDSELSLESKNPVQNKVVTAKLTELSNRYTNEQIDEMFGSYVDDIAELVGGVE